MRIAFYATLKAPDDPVPSGDRRVARALMSALERAGHEVVLASRLKTRDGKGDPERQREIAAQSAGEAEALLTAYRERKKPRPDLWFTYHLYYKASDWLGPAVAEALSIPYVVAEASVAHKRKDGPWDQGYRQTLKALEQAAAVISLTAADHANLPDKGKSHLLAPFLDPAPYAAAAQTRKPGTAARLITVAMMRAGDKLESYRLLAGALRRLEAAAWQLLIVGDGPASDEVRGLFAWADDERLSFAGAMPPERLPALYAGADLFVWPAWREGYGMAILEAQASGLPVVAGAALGVPELVRDGVTGLLTPPGDEAAFADALASLLSDPRRRHRMGARAMEEVARHHGIGEAARRLDEILRPLAEEGAR